jgi:putative peptidoglycan lipid II flippase
VAQEDSARGPSRVLRNTAIFSIATGLSRIAGLAREMVAAGFYGTTAAASAFTIAFQVPNLLRALVADAALSSAFVPEFTRLLEEGKRREAFSLAGALFGLILVVLGVLTVVFMLLAPVIMPLFTGSSFSSADDDLTSGLARVMFPIVVLLGLTGLVTGILNAYDHFSVPAIAPLVWNIVIIAGMVGLQGAFEGPEQIYAYAIGVVAATAVQLAMLIPMLRRVGFPVQIAWRPSDPRVKRVLQLMLPVTISLGLINFNLLINTTLGFRVSEEAPSAIDKAFRIYMLPQGMFSVAVATVLFPQLARLAARRDFPGLRRWSGDGMRLILLVLVPCAAATIALAEPITRLVFERGDFGPAATDATAEALLVFSFSLPFAGANLLLTRTFFSLQRPWTPTKLALGTLFINAAVSLALYGPLGIGGIVLGTAIASAAMTVGQIFYLRQELGGFEVVRTLTGLATMTAAAAVMGGACYGVWWLLDDLLGQGLLAQVLSVGVALLEGFLVYIGIVLVARLPEAAQLRRMLTRRSD